MSKLLFSIVGVIMAIAVNAQNTLPLVGEKVVFERIITRDGFSKDELYAATKKYFVDNFKNSNYVIKSEDKESGQIIGKGFMDMSFFKDGSILGKNYPYHFTIQTDVKEGRARIKIYDAYYELTHAQYGVLKSSTIEEENAVQSKGIEKSEKKKSKYISWVNHMNSCFEGLINSFEESLRSAPSKNDDW
ncbi:DUF4468 domain-containing protein [Sphingobacterium psychroaquaticum]|uniref:DUF4468 domain-containing protein n=1 Tax=Sphingobacterium psychroaquaticum TaxID=561061 RepID=UPI0010690CAD|nr:DUF4468 domain-containing protein [Sphingobacterium psychroaquaticum]QBQ41120.1 DUF4468 domain-containing protein [Sphingobacterium psychroaquaticum]